MAEAIKLTELIKNKGKLSYSFEVTPDVSEADIDNLKVEAVFFSVTWHAKTHMCKDLEIEPLKTASLLRTKNKHVLMHLSCDLMTTTYLTEVLKFLQEKNICNLLLVLGEGFDPMTSDFKTTSEMIKFIRDKTGQYFCIGIAGFPRCHHEKLLQIKHKVKAGADFIMTQAFFDVDSFKDLTDSLAKINVKIPIIPGIFPFETPKQLNSFIELCKIKVSSNLLQAANDKEKTKTPCTEIIKNLIYELNSKCQMTHFHFFTLNRLQNVEKIIEEIN